MTLVVPSNFMSPPSPLPSHQICKLDWKHVSGPRSPSEHQGQLGLKGRLQSKITKLFVHKFKTGDLPQLKRNVRLLSHYRGWFSTSPTPKHFSPPLIKLHLALCLFILTPFFPPPSGWDILGFSDLHSNLYLRKETLILGSSHSGYLTAMTTLRNIIEAISPYLKLLYYRISLKMWAHFKVCSKSHCKHNWSDYPKCFYSQQGHGQNFYSFFLKGTAIVVGKTSEGSGKAGIQQHINTATCWQMDFPHWNYNCSELALLLKG